LFSVVQHATLAAVAATPFQDWCESLLRSRGWTLRELARRLGVSASTPHHYRAGTVLPTVAMQRRLADLTGTPVEELARLVWESKGGSGARASAPAPAETRPAPSRAKPGMAWRGWRGRPLGVQFTMYPTKGIEDAPLERLYALATAGRASLEATLNEALRIALPLMERRSTRPRSEPRRYEPPIVAASIARLEAEPTG
jgi:transcriptional regulator with XRE-family HTH domain